jgi:hypothetical protein
MTSGKKRIRDRGEAGPKTGAALDYIALHREIPRQYDEPDLPDGWVSTSRQAISEGVEREFGASISDETAGFAWERIGANKSVRTAMRFLQEYRDELAAEGLATRKGNYEQGD